MYKTFITKTKLNPPPPHGCTPLSIFIIYIICVKLKKVMCIQIVLCIVTTISLI